MMSQEEELYIQIGQGLPESQQSQMFGKPCFKVGGKAFISLFDYCMVFKLNGDAHEDALSLDGSVLFDPSKKGRPMKEWIQVPFSYAEKWKDFAAYAYEYVKSELKKHRDQTINE